RRRSLAFPRLEQARGKETGLTTSSAIERNTGFEPSPDFLPSTRIAIFVRRATVPPGIVASAGVGAYPRRPPGGAQWKFLLFDMVVGWRCPSSSQDARLIKWPVRDRPAALDLPFPGTPKPRQPAAEPSSLPRARKTSSPALASMRVAQELPPDESTMTSTPTSAAITSTFRWS